MRKSLKLIVIGLAIAMALQLIIVLGLCVWTVNNSEKIVYELEILKNSIEFCNQVIEKRHPVP
jgi:hypothetical protein